MTLIAAGMGFAIRGGHPRRVGGRSSASPRASWAQITGGGLVGFGMTIILFSLIADRVGYKRAV